jgi:hypothetical protein
MKLTFGRIVLGIGIIVGIIATMFENPHTAVAHPLQGNFLIISLSLIIVGGAIFFIENFVANTKKRKE